MPKPLTLAFALGTPVEAFCIVRTPSLSAGRREPPRSGKQRSLAAALSFSTPFPLPPCRIPGSSLSLGQPPPFPSSWRSSPTSPTRNGPQAPCSGLSQHRSSHASNPGYQFEQSTWSSRLTDMLLDGFVGLSQKYQPREGVPETVLPQ